MKNKRNVLIYVMTILAFAVTSCHPLSSTYSPDSQISAITSESTSSSTSEPSTVISYSVIFKNYDGTILQSTEWEYGTMPSYNGNDPTREADSCFSYSFKGWSPEIQSVTAEATYVATYNYISNGTMTFNFEEDTYLIVHCSEEVTEIDIPSSYDDGINGEHPVTSIGTRAFSGCTLLTSITIPDNITSLGGASFFGCTSLTSVVISDSLTTLSTSLFSGCSSLTDVTLPRNLTYINTAAFVYCTSLAEISIPNTVTSIHVGAFSECTSLTNLVLPESITSIGEKAFDNCKSLTEITIPENVTTIGRGAFKGCSGLTQITIPKNVSSIGSDVFSKCTLLTQISVDPDNSYFLSIDGVLFTKDKKELITYPVGKTSTEYSVPETTTSIIDFAFSACKYLTKIILPENLTSIGCGAFCNCESLTEINIPDKVTIINESTFYVCTSLAEIIIPDNVTMIDDFAFNECTSLTSINIPKNVESLGFAVFNDCPSLTQITVNPDNLNFCAVDGILFNKDKTKLIKYPEGKEITQYVIPDFVTFIGSYAFSEFTSSSSVIIHKMVTTI